MKALINLSRQFAIRIIVNSSPKPTTSQLSLSLNRFYAKKTAQLTEAQLQFQKHTAELSFKEKSSIKGTKYEYNDVETSIKYMKSEAFKAAYKDKLIWQWYIRNHKGGMARMATRIECIGGNGRYMTGNPCPICRDPYLVVNYKNLDLLRHFTSPDTGNLLPARITNVCQKTQENLNVAYGKACNHGLIDHFIRHRHYNYQIYFPREAKLYARSSDGKTADEDKPSVLLGIILGANRKGITKIYDELNEEDINVS